MSKKVIQPIKIEFETFKNVTGTYYVEQLKQFKPSSINFLNYKKYKVTIEEIVEPKDVLINRLKEMLESSSNFREKDMIKSEIKKLENV